jgi:hypothetical protein
MRTLVAIGALSSHFLLSLDVHGQTKTCYQLEQSTWSELPARMHSNQLRLHESCEKPGTKVKGCATALSE